MLIMNLYQITQDQRYTLAEIESMEGELTPELEKRLEITANQLNSKSIAYLEVITTKEGFNSLIDVEIKRLQAIKKRNTNLVSRLKENLLNAVKTFGNFNVGLNAFSLKTTEYIEVNNINQLQAKYKTVKIVESADKNLLKQDIKKGEIIEGVEILTRTHLKIN